MSLKSISNILLQSVSKHANHAAATSYSTNLPGKDRCARSNATRRVTSDCLAGSRGGSPPQEDPLPLGTKTKGVANSNQFSVSFTAQRLYSKEMEKGQESETEIAKKNIEIRHLQPSMLPEFFTPKIDFNSATFAANQSQYRRIEMSTTQKNITKPLKGPRLANPFPEPVKVMPSDTVSDSEKAEKNLILATRSHKK